MLVLLLVVVVVISDTVVVDSHAMLSRCTPLKIPISPDHFPRNVSGWKLHVLPLEYNNRSFRGSWWFRIVLLSEVTESSCVVIFDERPMMLVQYAYGSDSLVISWACTRTPLWRWNNCRPLDCASRLFASVRSRSSGCLLSTLLFSPLLLSIVTRYCRLTVGVLFLVSLLITF